MNLKKTFLVFIILFVSFMGAKLLFSHHFAYKQTGLQSVVNNNKTDILIIGSSHVRFSYDTKSMEKDCQCSVRAISYSYLNFTLINKLLAHIKSEDKLPKRALIIDHYGLMFYKSREFVDTRLFFESPLSVKLDILKYMMKHFTKLSFNDYYQFVVTSNNEIFLNYFWNRPFVDRRDYNGSYQVKNIKGMKLEKYNSLQVSERVFSLKTIDTFEQASMFDINTSFQGDVPNILFVETPLPTSIYNNQKLKSFRTEYYPKYRELGLPILDSNLDPIRMNLNHTHFMDDNHLSTTGRSLFTKFIINKIKSL